MFFIFLGFLYAIAVVKIDDVCFRKVALNALKAFLSMSLTVTNTSQPGGGGVWVLGLKGVGYVQT